MEYLALINGTPRNVPQMKFRVPAETHAGLVGDWHAGKLYRPDNAALRAALPHRWRKAFDRSQLWHVENAARRSEGFRVPLHSARGRYLATVYLRPIAETESN